MRERLGLPPRSTPRDTSDDDQKFEGYGRRGSLAQYGHLEIVGRTVTFHENKEKRKQRRQKLLLLQEEKDRFDAMRQIQDEARRWKQYVILTHNPPPPMLTPNPPDPGP